MLQIGRIHEWNGKAQQRLINHGGLEILDQIQF
jgi:hypothetical protein